MAKRLIGIGASISVVAEVVRLRSELSRVRLLATVVSAPILTSFRYLFSTGVCLTALVWREFFAEAFRPLLDGTTNWPAVLEALDRIDYRGYLTFEYFHPYPHWPEALIYQTGDSLDRMLGLKA